MVEFAYAVGRVRALEAHMLDENSIIRMVDARDFEAAFHVLRENPVFAEHLDRLAHPFDFAALISHELRSVKDLLGELAPGNDLLAVFWKKYEEDIPLDSYLAELLKTMEKHQVPIFAAYARGFIALSNLKRALLKGAIDTESVVNKFRYTDYARAVIAGMASYKKTGSLFALEREIDNFLMKVIKNAKYRAFGVEPLLGFAFAKEIESKIIRLVLTAKRMHVQPEEIKARLRLSYV